MLYLVKIIYNTENNTEKSFSYILDAPNYKKARLKIIESVGRDFTNVILELRKLKDETKRPASIGLIKG